MWDRVRRHAPALGLAATAAGLSYLLAGLIFGVEHALFAPVAAVISIGLSAGQRWRRAVEITIGVVLGLLAADLLSRWVGIGAWQLALAVLLAMTAAVAFRTSGLMANQAAVAAVVVMALVPFQEVGPFVRLGDALIGGLVAVTLNAVLAPDPHRAATTAAEQFLERFGAGLAQLARALDEVSLDRAESALDEMQGLGDGRQEIDEAVAATRERLRFARAPRRSELPRRLRRIQQVASRVDLMLASGRSLSRAVASVVRHGDRSEGRFTGAVEELTQAVAELRRWVGDQSRADSVREMALRAGRTASSTLSARQSPTDNVLVWQVRSAVVDILRVTGMSQGDAVATLEAEAGRADQPGHGDSPSPDA